MAKGTSFAEKAKRGKKKEKEFTVVKYVKSIVSEKSGHYRFQESMLKVPSDKSLDAYLKELEFGPVEEVDEVADAQENSTADIQEPKANEMQSEEGGEPSGEPSGEEVATEASEPESAETSNNSNVPEEEAAENEDVDREASEPVDEPKDEKPETTKEEHVEESDQDDVPSEETVDAEAPIQKKKYQKSHPKRNQTDFSLSLYNDFLTFGEVAERLKAHAWKACVRSRVPRVRIPPSPLS